MLLNVQIEGEEPKIIEDVDQYCFYENLVEVVTNQGDKHFIKLRDNDGVGNKDWYKVTIIAERRSLKL